jgi:hypothetical protein
VVNPVSGNWQSNLSITLNFEQNWLMQQHKRWFLCKVSHDVPEGTDRLPNLLGPEYYRYLNPVNDSATLGLEATATIG